MEQNHCTTKTGKWKQLTERDRYKIEAYFQAGLKPQEIAAYIGCSKRTIERERRLGMTAQLKPATKNIKACGDLQVQWVYLADVAQRRHEENAARKGRGLKIDKDHALARHIEHKIKIELTNDDLLYKKNRDKQTENSRHGVAWNNRDGKSIDERPEPVNRREEFGHWEIDLVVGRKGTKPVILTLVERQTRKSLYVLIKNKSQKEVLQALRRLQQRVKGDFTHVFKSITADNGSEFLDGEGMKRAAKCGEVYYAHPYSSWERGSNENGNRMLRRFLPKGTDFSKLKPKELQRIEDWVNNYPRKIFGYKSANDMYAAMI